MKLLEVKSLFASADRAAAKAEVRRQELLAEAQRQSEQAALEKDIIGRLSSFQKRLSAYHAQLLELREILSEKQTLRAYEAAIMQSIAVSFSYPDRQPLRLENIAEALLVQNNRTALLKCAEIFVKKLETEVETFVADHREILERHGAAL